MCQDLQAAELQEALVRKTTSLCVVQPLKEEEDRGEPSLGPTIQATVEIEGSTVEALVDTGSPITIASVECLLDILEKRRPSGQSPAEWMKRTKARFQPPKMTINNYEVNIIAQFLTMLRHGNRQCHVTILVQRGASLSILLGTDVLDLLGFHLVENPLHGPVIDVVIRQGKESPCPDMGSTQGLEAIEWERLSCIDVFDLHSDRERASVNVIEVKLLQDTRIAAWCGKTVRVRTELHTDKPLLFEPVNGTLKANDVIGHVHPAKVVVQEDVAHTFCTSPDQEIIQ